MTKNRTTIRFEDGSVLVRSYFRSIERAEKWVKSFDGVVSYEIEEGR